MTEAEIQTALDQFRAGGGLIVDDDLPQVIALAHHLQRSYGSVSRASLQLAAAAHRDASGEGPYDRAAAQRRGTSTPIVEAEPEADPTEPPLPYTIAIAARKARAARGGRS